MIVGWIILGLIIWTVISITCTWFYLGNKDSDQKHKWYHNILGMPVLTIAAIIGYLNSRKNSQ